MYHVPSLGIYNSPFILSVLIQFTLYLRHHVPFYTFILHNLNYLFLVCNSSVNFIVYCCVGRDFKARLETLVRILIVQNIRTFQAGEATQVLVLLLLLRLNV